MAARRVKCRDTGEYSTSDVAYKAPDGKYYSSEAAYSSSVIQKESRSQCIELWYELLQYQAWQKMPSLVFSKLKSWEPYGYDVVYATMNGERQRINWALVNKQFKNDSQCIAYLCAIIENNLNDYYKVINYARKKEAVVHKVEIDDEAPIQVQRTRKDVSNLLGDIS